MTLTCLFCWTVFMSCTQVALGLGGEDFFRNQYGFERAVFVDRCTDMLSVHVLFC